MSSVAALAGVSRTTFYEFFDDFAHAMAACSVLAVRELARQLESSASNELKQTCEHWLRFAEERPALMLCALNGDAAVSAFVASVLSLDSSNADRAFAVAACARHAAMSVAQGSLDGADAQRVPGPYLGLGQRAASALVSLERALAQIVSDTPPSNSAAP
ncbi:MAG: hypothetical protein QM756_23310 [Polyangiaceae bacterium]